MLNPSYVEFEGFIPASSGELVGPSQVEISAEAHGVSNIKITRRAACLIGFTKVNPESVGLNLRPICSVISIEGLIGGPRHGEKHGRTDLPQPVSSQGS